MPSSPHFAIPLSLRIRLSQYMYHLAIVALSKSAFLPTTHSFPLSLHQYTDMHLTASARRIAI